MGDRFGPLALFASVDHVASHGQPLTYVTGRAAGRAPSGGVAVLNRTGVPIRVLGASGIEHQLQDNLKFKAALDVTPDIRLTYVGGLFLNDTDAHAETYPHQPSRPAQAAYHRAASRAASITSTSATGRTRCPPPDDGDRFDWQVIGTLYDFAHDVQRTPTGLLPGALAGGAGNITRLDGTGWKTIDAKGVWRSDAAATHSISFGAHGDWFTLEERPLHHDRLDPRQRGRAQPPVARQDAHRRRLGAGCVEAAPALHADGRRPLRMVEGL